MGIHTTGIHPPGTTSERLALGVVLSLVLHVLLAVLAVTVLPKLMQRFASQTVETPPVLTFQFADRTADVDPSSRVEVAPETPLQGEFASRARDRSRGDRDTPIPAGATRANENTLPGDGSMKPFETAQVASPEPTDADPRPADPDAGREAVLDGLRSETAILTGKRTARPKPAVGGGPGARTMEDLGPDGALQFDDNTVSFSTTAWQWEPYWHQMKRRLYANWNPPAAYRDYGIIQGGWTVVRATLNRQGRLIACTILGEHGHESLHPASFAAMQGAAPFRALPADFPDDSLVVTVKFIYLQPGVARPQPMP